MIYHLVSRFNGRFQAFHDQEKEKFRTLMRMTEKFTGCRVLAYCLMSNHFHLLLEVPPMPEGGLSDEEFFRRLEVFYPAWRVSELRLELQAAREAGNEQEVARITGQFTYRMHDLSEFMKTLLQRFSTWFNTTHKRTGRLWEQRFKSLLVEGGTASRAVAAYIDLNPVRAGICEDPADYRWSSYAEAVAGGKKARAGLSRALRGHARLDARLDGSESAAAAAAAAGTAGDWAGGGLAKAYRAMLLGLGTEVVVDGEVKRRGMSEARAEREQERLREMKRDLSISRMIRHRVRYFTDGAAIGSRSYVEEVFRECRQYFGARRKTGARKPRGALGGLAGEVWTARDLRVEIGNG